MPRGPIAVFRDEDAEKVLGRRITDGEYRALCKVAEIRLSEEFTEMVLETIEDQGGQ